MSVPQPWRPQAMCPTICLTLLLLTQQCGSVDSGRLWLQFYYDRVGLWEQEGQLSKFQSAIVEGLTAYCANSANLVNCGLVAANASLVFNTSAVSITSGYPMNNGSWYMDLRYTISYNAGGPVYTMPTAAVAEITVNQRQTIKDRIGYYIVYIGSKFYTIPPPTLINQVVVSISVLATALLVAIAVGLRHRHRDENMQSLIRTRRTASAGSGNKIGASTELRTPAASAQATLPSTMPPPPPKQAKVAATMENSGHRGPQPAGRMAEGRQGAHGSDEASWNTGLPNFGFDRSLGEYEMRAANRLPPPAAEVEAAAETAETAGSHRRRPRQQQQPEEFGEDAEQRRHGGDGGSGGGKVKKAKKKRRSRHESEGKPLPLPTTQRRLEADETTEASATLMEEVAVGRSSGGSPRSPTVDI